MLNEAEFQRERRSIYSSGLCTSCKLTDALPSTSRAKQVVKWIVTCSRCRRSWYWLPAFESQVPDPVTQLPNQAKLRPVAQEAEAVDLSSYRLLGYKPGQKADQDLTETIYNFNNLQSSSSRVETITVRQRHAIAVSVDVTKATSSSGGGGFNFAGVIAAQARLSNDVRKAQSDSRESELILEQSTAVTIPARTRISFVVHWKLVWQHGTAQLVAGGQQLDVPYAVTTALRFDTEAVDLT